MIDALAALAIPIIVAAIAAGPGWLSARRMRAENNAAHGAGLALMASIQEDTRANTAQLGEIKIWTVRHEERHRRLEDDRSETLDRSQT